MKQIMSILALAIVLMYSLSAMAQNRVVVIPLGDELYVLGTSSCDSSDVTLCTSSDDCTAAGGYWWSDSTCLGIPESETVTSAGSRIWMDRNLGASRVATNSTDSEAYGDLYQWGRSSDGHQLRTSAETSITSSTDDPGHGNFILTNTFPYDWRVPQKESLWQGLSGINNPCPAGFRIPNDSEWETERLSWSSNDGAGAFASPLKLVMAGYRSRVGGNLIGVGTLGYYWSSTINAYDGTLANLLYYYTADFAGMGGTQRAFGHSVRCIKD